jgi:hypothetical protein
VFQLGFLSDYRQGVLRGASGHHQLKPDHIAASELLPGRLGATLSVPAKVQSVKILRHGVMSCIAVFFVT